MIGIKKIIKLIGYCGSLGIKTLGQLAKFKEDYCCDDNEDLLTTLEIKEDIERWNECPQ